MFGPNRLSVQTSGLLAAKCGIHINRVFIVKQGLATSCNQIPASVFAKMQQTGPTRGSPPRPINRQVHGGVNIDEPAHKFLSKFKIASNKSGNQINYIPMIEHTAVHLTPRWKTTPLGDMDNRAKT